MPLLNFFFIVILLVFSKELLKFASSVNAEQKYYPILLWHSAGETCCDHEVNLYKNYLRTELNNNAIVKAVRIGNTKKDDFTNSLTLHPFEQINYVCKKLRENPIYHNGYNAVGLSQGALFFRGLAQICPFPPMLNLISLGGPHNGVDNYPRCDQTFGALSCEFLKFKINIKVYNKFIAPATYWHNVRDEERYRRSSSFLSIINNELQRNEEFIRNLQRLRKLVLVKFANDISVVPNESSWFGYYNESGASYPLESTDIYQEDKLGLRKMINERRLIRLLSPLAHLELDKVWFRHNLISILMEK